jgi:hypothetical protein
MRPREEGCESKRLQERRDRTQAAEGGVLFLEDGEDGEDGGRKMERANRMGPSDDLSSTSYSLHFGWGGGDLWSMDEG